MWDEMNELSLFTGAGGGVLGSKLLGHRIIGYVEYEKYCQEILKQRIRDGILDEAPIFGDIGEFISNGYAKRYKGKCDLITGGFPCQPFSVAGKGLGEADPRNMWPATIECIRIIRPPYVFLENVPGLLTNKYMGRIFGDLAAAGYSARWAVLGGFAMGMCINGERLWIFASKANSFRVDEVKISLTPNCETGPLRRQFDRASSAFISEETYSPIYRNPDDLARWMVRFKAIGNGQVPLCMAYAFSKLSEGII